MYSEWKDLVGKAKEGNEESKLEILSRLNPLIISSIKRYYNRIEDYEELIQEGKLCILEAIINFDPSKNVYFLGYVKLQLKYLYINKNRLRHHLSLNLEVGDESKEELVNLIPSSLEEPVTGIIRVELGKDLRNSLKTLTARQRHIVMLFYVERMSIGEIAQLLGVKYRTVVNTKTRAIEKLKNTIVK